jgi:hypothetical protein
MPIATSPPSGTAEFEFVGFVYLDTQSAAHPVVHVDLSVGGLLVCFAEDSRDPNVRSSIIFAITGPRALLARFWSKALGEEIEAAA